MKLFRFRHSGVVTYYWFPVGSTDTHEKILDLADTFTNGVEHLVNANNDYSPEGVLEFRITRSGNLDDLYTNRHKTHQDL